MQGFPILDKQRINDAAPKLYFNSSFKTYQPKSITIKYIGSKDKIIPTILKEIKKCSGVKTILDGFSGSCRVSQSLSLNGYKVTVNDMTSYSYTLANCFLFGKETAKLKELLNYLNNIKGYEGWYSQKYGGNLKDTKKPFQLHNTKKLDGIIDELEKIEIDKIERYIVLTSLLIALDRVDSTLGHQSSYLKEWSARSYKTMELKMPTFYNPHYLEHLIYQKDIFDIASKYHDLAYYDPPYGSNNDKMPASRVRYKSYYHIWETIVKNDKPETFGVNHRRVDTKDQNNINPFEDFRKTNDVYNSDLAIDTLIKKTNAKYILFSYNSNGRTSINNLIDILDKYLNILNIEKIPYRKNIMAYMNSNQNWQNEFKNYEILILGKKK